MTFPAPSNSRVWVRGRFVDLGKAARGEELRGMRTPVWFDPSPAGAVIDTATEQIFSAAAWAVTPSPTDGYFAVYLPATDDPEVAPTGWTYQVTEPTGRRYSIVVPLATPILDAPGDPLHGQRVLDLITVMPAPSPQPGTVQLMTGRGIADMVIDEDGHLVVTYTDAATADLGLVVGGTTPGSGVEPFEFQQATPATVWGPIAHGFGRRPVAWSLYDEDDRECDEYEVQHLDLDTCRVSMDVPTAGVIRLL